jgi:hypothetical protein
LTYSFYYSEAPSQKLLDDGDEADWIVMYMDVPINQSLQEGRRLQQARGSMLMRMACCWAGNKKNEWMFLPEFPSSRGGGKKLFGIDDPHAISKNKNA